MNVKIDKYAISIIIDREIDKALGTGFTLLRKDWIVTAKHVVFENGLPRRDLALSFLNTTKNVAAFVLAAHPELDLAILQATDSTPCGRPLHPGYDDLHGNLGVFYAGYSPSKSATQDGGLVMLIEHARVYKKYERTRRTSEFVIEFDSDSIEGGFSGGPVLGQGGSVLGIIVEKFSAGAASARATSIRGLMDGIQFDVAAQWLIERGG